MFDNRTVTDEKAWVDFQSFKTLRFESTYFQFLSCRALTMRAGQKLGWQVGVWPRDGRIICQPGQGFRVSFIFFIIDFRLGSNQERWACRTFPPTDESQRSNCCRRLLRKEGDTSLFICHYPVPRFAMWTLDPLDSRTVWSRTQRSALEESPIEVLVVATLGERWSPRTTISRAGRPSGSSATSLATSWSGLSVGPTNSPCSQKSASEYKILMKSPFSRKKEEKHFEQINALFDVMFFFRYLGWIANQFNLDPPLS